MWSANFVMKNHEDDQIKKTKFWSAEEAPILIRRYCALQERCHSEVRTKLLNHGIYGDLLDEIISGLIVENYLDEERFAKLFAGGKFRIKKWGKNKIIKELKQKQVSEYSIREALKEIDDETYLNTLQDLASKKDRTSKYKNKFDRLNKLTSFLMGKGYEYPLVLEVINRLETDDS